MLKRLLLGLILLLVALAISGYIYQAIAEVSDRETFPPPGQLLRVDGSLMHIECQGEGDPTVVVEQGLGSQSVAWYDIHQQVASTTRICAYDRPGLGYSEPLPQPIRSTEVAQRLNKLLIAADIKGELILVGWSAGGVYIREFYRQFPDNVKGMVFVDSSHERQGFRLPQFEGGDDNLLRIANYLAPFGVLRISGLVESRTQGLKAPEDIKARIIALYNQSHAIQTLLNESEAFSQDVRSDNDPEP
ncbi:MAG: alpha/beta hydrolase, partial [Pseudomonadota bacterium]